MFSQLVAQVEAVVGAYGDEHLARTVVLASVPLVLIWAYIKLVRVPPHERPIKFVWDVPAEAE